MSQEKVRVAVTVSGGVCEAHTCPAFVDLFIIDYDNLKETALADIDPSTAEWLRENDKEFWYRRVKEDTSMKEVFLMGDQPTTCAKCGCHTNFTDNFDGTQDHVCLGCGFKFVVEVDTPGKP